MTLQVTAHHETLLTQASGAKDLQESLVMVRRGLADVTQSLEKYVALSRLPQSHL